MRIIGFAAAGLLLATSLPAQQAPAAEDVEAGKRLFGIYCENCHGAGAHGDGPTAAILTVHPADLTGLTERNGGTFPAEQVRRAIDGRDTIQGHGAREMPIWGLAFQELDSDANQERQVRTKIDRLVAYLSTIQN